MDETQPATPFFHSAGHRVRRRTRWVSIAGSCLVHAGLIVIATLLWLRARDAWLASGPSVVITFDTPGVGEPPSLPSSSETPIAPTPRGPAEARLELAPIAPAPADALPALTSLADEQGAPSSHLSSALPTSPVAAPASMFSVGAAPAGAATAMSPGEAGGADAAVSFSGLGASNARSVVYVVDASGSMVASLPLVIAELERSVARLSPTQKFAVVLFRRLPSGEDGTETFSPVLVRATPSAKELLANWLACTRPSGRSSPLAGLERAAAYRPDAVFLLSRSIERSGGNVWEHGLDGTISRVDSLNPARRMLIQTIQFLDDDPTGIMQEIGRRHGSSRDSKGREVVGYRLVGRGEDLGGAPAGTTWPAESEHGSGGPR